MPSKVEIESKLSSLLDIAATDVSKSEKRITDNIFICIENNSDLLDTYTNICNLTSQNYINRKLGKLIKETFSLSDTAFKVKAKSSLIKTFTMH
ncbi:hypothetical protein C9J12_11770 [Photobacterium frigidiphilum]|uniref:Uncharacterized protein n=1 Tax=Photobacterium frigidiphilum TaxID=264736 RepID=A0A2T3JH57_9GAMM|nr:hypothetical protein [Photobacterium frigidiphilum]PSU48288.1 hypothetical protein C9J12_11770 [Photobacterium frigidiphilum]